jgi:putative Ca2+/H+ antiporter (TMEM165/GDT1 family)
MTTFRLLLSVFGVIFVAELPDKTALAALVLATQYYPLPVFIGAGLALTVQSVVAVVAGGMLSTLPARGVHIGAGLLFLVCALLMWRRHPDRDGEHWEMREGSVGAPGFPRVLARVFVVVFIAEWGDLTQFGTAALAAHYHDAFTVFWGATLALWTVAALAVFVGNKAGTLLDPDRTKMVAAGVFAVIGVLLMVGTI